LKFKLVGILNSFDIMPDFVIPIFVCLQDIATDEPRKIYYFQVVNDESDTLSCFSKLSNYDEHYIKNVQFLEKATSYTDVLFDVHSKPLYAFQSSKDDVFIGNYGEMKEFLGKYKTEDDILKEEIQDFLELESQNIWKRLRVLLEENFPNDSKEEIEMKLRTLRCNDFENKTFELYAPKFHDSVLRVGICVKGENRKAYFSTKLGEELEEVASELKN
jgi:hypothetical protein